MNFYSTNKHSPSVNFEQAILTGQAPDGGLYIPENMPHLDASFFEKLLTGSMSYSDIGLEVLKPFLGDEIPQAELKKMLDEAYNFDMPIEQIKGHDDLYIFRQDFGPTAAFKDYAARLMARMMNYFLESQSRKVTILVATSGDTGGAVADAFEGLSNIEIVILFPIDEVSTIQKKQLTIPRSNVKVLAINGKFDDCQSFVKRAFRDERLKEKLDLSSANSINFGRLLPQCIYYFYVYSQIAKSLDEKLLISVPSGNLGNVCGGLIAKMMGLPIHKMIAAVNENDELPQFLASQKYQPVVPSKNCISNAMNIGHPSNLARIVTWFGGEMDENGTIKTLPNMEIFMKHLTSYMVTDQETEATLKEVYEYGWAHLDPHTAVGWKALMKHLAANNADKQYKKVIFQTAHPAKFPEPMERVLGKKPEVPAHLQKYLDSEEQYETLEADYEVFRSALLS